MDKLRRHRSIFESLLRSPRTCHGLSANVAVSSLATQHGSGSEQVADIEIDCVGGVGKSRASDATVWLIFGVLDDIDDKCRGG